MCRFQIYLTGTHLESIYRVFQRKTKGTKVKLSDYDITSSHVSFVLEYPYNDALLLSIVKTLNLCSDWKFSCNVYELMQGTLDGKKRIIYFTP